MDYSLKVKNKYEHLKKQEIQHNILKKKLNKACFQHGLVYGDFRNLAKKLIKHYVINHLIMLKIQNMMDINVNILQWFIHFLIKRLQVVLLKVKICRTKNCLKNYTNQLLENLKNEKYTYLFETIFRVLM